LRERPHRDVEVAPSLDAALSLIADTPGPAFIIGGAVLYATALPHVSVMHLTELDSPVDGDVMFPPFDRSQWRLVNAIPHARDDRHATGFNFSRYERL